MRTDTTDLDRASQHGRCNADNWMGECSKPPGQPANDYEANVTELMIGSRRPRTDNVLRTCTATEEDRGRNETDVCVFTKGYRSAVYTRSAT